ncbi:MAG: hypothetical protein MRY74_06695 [Neomegalonema sp.]|nr:hypothetical protein [Neomegalonema sp.]
MSKETEYKVPSPQEIDAYVKQARKMRAEAVRELLGFGKKEAPVAAPVAPKGLATS